MPYNLSRPNYYDRNPSTIIEDVEVNPAASTLAFTTEWTYTVPTGRKAMVETLYCAALNISTSALNGYAGAQIQYQKGSGTYNDIAGAFVVTGQSSVCQTNVSGSSDMVILDGDSIRGTAFSDNSAASSNVQLETGMKATEFDA